MSDDIIDLTVSSDHEDIDDASLSQLHVAIANVPEHDCAKSWTSSWTTIVQYDMPCSKSS